MAKEEEVRQQQAATAQLMETKKRYDQATKELTQSRVDLAKAEKAGQEMAKRTQGEIARYESEIQASNKKRIANEAEQIRLESESIKLQEYASRMKENRDQNVDQSEDSDGLVLKSSLALESSRNAVANTMEAADQTKFKAQKTKHQARGLANAEEASNLVSGGRIWITSKDCKAYNKPNTSDPAGFIGSGKRLLGKDHGSKWVEIVNGSGASVFMERHCGSYEEQ